jgi:hypothetical protein
VTAEWSAPFTLTLCIDRSPLGIFVVTAPEWPRLCIIDYSLEVAMARIGEALRAGALAVERP